MAASLGTRKAAPALPPPLPTCFLFSRRPREEPLASSPPVLPWMGGLTPTAPRSSPPAAARAAVRGGPAGLPVFLSRRGSSLRPPHRHLPPEASAGEVLGWPPGPHPLWTQH